MENTDAESVDAIVDAKSKHDAMPSVRPNIKSKTPFITKPVIIAVSATPTVAKMIPWVNTGRMSENLVSIPPENKITHRATVPMVEAVSKLSNIMSFRPPSPNNIPVKRNISKIGTPNLYPALHAQRLANAKTAAINKNPSITV